MAALLGALVLLTLPQASRADLKVVQRVTIDSPQMKAMMESLSPQQRQRMNEMGMGMMSGRPTQATLYARGPKARADLGLLSFVYDAGAGQIVTINRSAHTYSGQKIDRTREAAGTQTTVKSVAGSKSVLGHACRHYTFRATSPNLPGGEIVGDLWAAPDLPSLPAPVAQAGPVGALRGVYSKIKGLPLLTNVKVIGAPTGDMTVKTVATAVSQGMLSASLFAVPAGYTQTPPGTNAMPGMPGMEGGMGD